MPTLQVRTPTILWEATSRRVLTMEWIEGVKLTDQRRMTEAGLSIIDFVNVRRMFCLTRLTHWQHSLACADLRGFMILCLWSCCSSLDCSSGRPEFLHPHRRWAFSALCGSSWSMAFSMLTPTQVSQRCTRCKRLMDAWAIAFVLSGLLRGTSSFPLHAAWSVPGIPSDRRRNVETLITSVDNPSPWTGNLLATKGGDLVYLGMRSLLLSNLHDTPACAPTAPHSPICRQVCLAVEDTFSTFL